MLIYFYSFLTSFTIYLAPAFSRFLFLSFKKKGFILNYLFLPFHFFLLIRKFSFYLYSFNHSLGHLIFTFKSLMFINISIFLQNNIWNANKFSPFLSCLFAIVFLLAPQNFYIFSNLLLPTLFSQISETSYFWF